jgi:DNA-binding XRE family transcriptional regulator
MSVKTKIKLIRLALGLTQPKLAEIMGIQRQAITRIESIKYPSNTPSIEAANKLVSYCEKENFYIGTKKNKQRVTLDYLFRNDEPINQ